MLFAFGCNQYLELQSFLCHEEIMVYGDIGGSDSNITLYHFISLLYQSYSENRNSFGEEPIVFEHKTLIFLLTLNYIIT